MSELRVEIPEGYEPEVIEPWKGEDRGPEVMYWVYNKEGAAKSYLNADAKEVCEWAQELHKMPRFHDHNLFSLALPKAKLLDVALMLSIIKSRNLFGGPEFWDELPEWQRMKKLEKKEQKKKEKK